MLVFHHAFISFHACVLDFYTSGSFMLVDSFFIECKSSSISFGLLMLVRNFSMDRKPLYNLFIVSVSQVAEFQLDVLVDVE